MAGDRGLAHDLRTRLDQEKVMSGMEVEQSVALDPLDELFYKRPIRQHVREFACVWSIIVCVVAGWLILSKGAPTTPLLTCGVLVVALLGLGYRAPRVLLPIWRGWMKFAEKLGLFMTTAIMVISWAILVIPIGILLKIIRKRVMDCSFDRSAKTYWEERSEKINSFERLELQY